MNRFCILVLGFAVMFGCGSEKASELQVGDQLVERSSQELYGSKGRYWNWDADGRVRIPVCWLSGGYDTEKSWVRSSVEDQWGAVSTVQFTGWGPCSLSMPYNAIRIQIEDTSTAPRSYVGMVGMSPSMWLNFTFNNWGTSCASYWEREYCIRGISLHEFGHALGFFHEQDRPDNNGQCNNSVQYQSNGEVLGSYDSDSVMNYCVSPWGRNTLSAGDIQGMRQVYGAPLHSTPSFFVGFKANDSSNQLYVTGSADGASFRMPAVGYSGITLQDSPAMAAFNGRLYIAFRANDGSNNLYVTSSSDGYTFQSPAVRYSGIKLQGSPAMAAFNGRLYIAFRANDSSNTLFVTSSSDGYNFQSPAVGYSGIKFQGSPAMAAFNGRLYIAFRANDSSNTLFVTSSSDGYTFQSPAVGYSGIALQDSPTMAAFNGRLYIAFRSNDTSNTLFVTSSSDGYTFQSPAVRYSGIALQGSPAMAAFNGRLYIAFRSNDASNTLFVTSSSDGYTFQSPAVGYSRIGLQGSPAIAFFGP
jgi:hypothetical protein